MIKILAPALRHPMNRELADFQRYWLEVHAPLASPRIAEVRRSTVLVTLPEAYASGLPTYDGAWMAWYEDVESMLAAGTHHEWEQTLRRIQMADDEQLFDREPGWPRHHKRASVVASENVIVDGPTAPESVKLIRIVARRPGLTHAEFFEHWSEGHTRFIAALPGLRRYVQNHALIDVLPRRGMTHDGWSELWFDDYDALQAAIASVAWRDVEADGGSLFAEPVGVVVGRETVIKDFDHVLASSDVADLDDAAIRARLEQDGYSALAADLDVPRRLREAAANSMLAIWHPEHLVAIDGAGLDARPNRP